MRKYYIAYGSNLSVEKMKVRCPEAHIAGMSAIDNWKLCFRFHATIEPCAGRITPVLVWTISESDEEKLDRYEGFPDYYTKINFDIPLLSLHGHYLRDISAMAYIMTEGHRCEAPLRTYYDILAEGYRKFGFDSYQLDLAMREVQEYGVS